MQTTTVTITNPTRRRQWGWNYSTTPTGHGTNIAPVTEPDYVGTLNQVRECIRNDRGLAAARSGGVYMSTGWFYGDKRICRVWDDMQDAWVTMSDILPMWDLAGMPKTVTLKLVSEN